MRLTRAWTGFWLALAGLLLMVPTAHAQSLPRHGSIVIYGFAGGINQTMKDVNDVLLQQQDELRESGLLPNYQLYDLTWSLGGGLGFQLMKRITLGVEYSYQDQTLQNDVFVGPRNFESGILNGTGGKMKDLTFNVTWYPPLDDGLFIGAGVGYGESEMYEQIDIRIAFSPELNSTFRGDYTGSGVTGQAFIGYHFNFVWGTRLQVRGGYRYQNMTVRVDKPGAVRRARSVAVRITRGRGPRASEP